MLQKQENIFTYHVHSKQVTMAEALIQCFLHSL